MTARLHALLSNARANFTARGGTVNGRKRARQHTRQIVKVSRLDTVEWTGNLNEKNPLYALDAIIGVRNDPEIDEAIRDLFYGDLHDPQARPGYLNAPELLQDIFMVFLKAQPTLYRKAEVVKDARLNGKFIEQVMALPGYDEVHDYTIGEPQTAKDATLAFVEVIKELIRIHREAVEETNRLREAAGCDPFGLPGNSDNANESWDEETSTAAGRAGDTGGRSQFDDTEPGEDDEPDWDYHDLDHEPNEQPSTDADGSGSGDDEDPDANIDNVDRRFNDDYLDEQYDDESDWRRLLDDVDITRAAHSALQRAAAELTELNEARRGVGLDDTEWKMMDPAARLEVANRLRTPRMRAIAEMVGRMKRFALSKQAQKVIEAPHEIYTVEIGNDLRRVLLPELALLGTPETKIEFYRRYFEGVLLQYRERGHEKVGKGPVICCVDNSGSMSGAPENWAKGVAEALRRVCQDQDRDFHVIYFETNRHRERFDFPNGRGSFDKVMAFLGIQAGGGTEFDGVLMEALNKAQTFYEGRPGAGKSDIVFITDGQAYLNDQWIDRFNEERTTAGVRVFSIFISAYDSDRSSAMQLLRRFSDVAIPVKQLEVNDDTTSTLFSQI